MDSFSATSATDRFRSAEDFIRIQDLWALCLSHWYWFLLSLAVFGGMATAYLLVTPPVYTRSASILIKEEAKGGSSSAEFSGLSDIGIFHTSSNVNNELISLQSPAVVQEVVRRLHLEVDYHTEGRFHQEVAYGMQLPVTLTFPDLQDLDQAALLLELCADGSAVLSCFERNGETLENKRVKCPLGKTVKTPLGKVKVASSPYYLPGMEVQLKVSRSSVNAAVEHCSANLSAALSDEKATVIEVSYKDVSVQRAEDVLNTLIAVYNENWVKDKNQIAVSTSMFIKERLGVIEQELGHVDQDISSYKSAHLLPDVQAASNMYMARANEVSSQTLALNNKLYMARYIRNYLTGESGVGQLLPVNSGIENPHIESQIAEYNEKLLQRNSLVANSSVQNPLVVDMDQALAAMRRAIVSSIDNLLVTLNTQMRSLQQTGQQTTAQIAANPTQAKYLLSVERQQKVKESLYLFLLQKREENELSQAFTAYNTRVISPPAGRMTPTAPQRRNILMVALGLGLLLPLIILLIRESLNTSVRGRKDLERLTAPFAGEIPMACRKHREKEAAIVVKEHCRNQINEAFRVVRTNLEFMLGKDGRNKVIMFSSMNPDSGKTFISMNLALSLAVKGKRVVVLDFDLRKASLSLYVGSPKNGISDFLAGQTDEIGELMVCGTLHPCLDVLPAGTLPPNPTELLFSDRMSVLFERLRSSHDYVFIDCPPVEMLADASIISKWVDFTLFIVRAGLLDRSLLPEIEKYYTEHKYPNLSVILNGTTETYNRYGYHKYGYRYGYGEKEE